MIGWEVLFGVGALVLFMALAFGAFQYHSRDRRKDPQGEAATRAQYDRPNAATSRGEDMDERGGPPSPGAAAPNRTSD